MRYIRNRIGFLLLSIWAVLTLNFFIPHDAEQSGDGAFGSFYCKRSPNVRKALEAQWGISRAPLQYGSYLINLAHGHLSVSVTYYPSIVETQHEVTRHLVAKIPDRNVL